jgi:hypothetical protein
MERLEEMGGIPWGRYALKIWNIYIHEGWPVPCLLGHDKGTSGVFAEREEGPSARCLEKSWAACKLLIEDEGPGCKLLIADEARFATC